MQQACKYDDITEGHERPRPHQHTTIQPLWHLISIERTQIHHTQKTLIMLLNNKYERVVAIKCRLNPSVLLKVIWTL